MTDQGRRSICRAGCCGDSSCSRNGTEFLRPLCAAARTNHHPRNEAGHEFSEHYPSLGPRILTGCPAHSIPPFCINIKLQTRAGARSGCRLSARAVRANIDTAHAVEVGAVGYGEPSSSSAPSPASRPLAALALGDGQTATGVLVSNYRPITCMIAVY
jgi:hypothetical protein